MAPVSIRKEIGLPATSRVTLGFEGVIGVGAVGPRHPQSSVARPSRLGRLRLLFQLFGGNRCDPSLKG